MPHSNRSLAFHSAHPVSRRSPRSSPWSGVRVSRFAVVALVALTVGACARTARLDSSWRDPGFRGGSLNRLLVVAVGRTPLERRLFEDRFVSALRARGADAQPSYQLIGDARVDSALVEAQMHRAGCDGIFVSRVVDRQAVRRFYGGGYGPAYYPGPRGYYGPPSGYHAGWWPYYFGGFTYATAVAFAVEDQRVSVETNLYRHDNGQLVWSGLSRQWLAATDPPGSETEGVVRELVAELARSGVVRVGAAPVAWRADTPAARADSRVGALGERPQ